MEKTITSPINKEKTKKLPKTIVKKLPKKRPINAEKLKDEAKALAGIGIVYFYTTEGPNSKREKDGEQQFRCKIGRTKYAAYKRGAQLQTGNPEEYHLLGQIGSTNYIEIEKELHNRYENRKIKREWFWLTLAILADIQEEYEFIFVE